MEYHNGEKFTASDEDNDGWSGGKCSVNRHGAWWYNDCTYSNLNGDYGGPGVSGWRYNSWHHWKNNAESLKSSLMMIRPKQ
jgi:hypothetical protein